MRGHLEAWGRARWPDARVFHELVVGDCRVDLAFICPDDLIGIEIKSSKDTLDRLEKQTRVFRDHLPEVWIAIAPKWQNDPRVDRYYRMVVGEAGIIPERWPGDPYRNALVYPNMLNLLWADEARAIAARKGCLASKRAPLGVVLPELALHLTGRELLTEVCRELRGRPTANKADDPVRLDDAPAARPSLFK